MNMRDAGRLAAVDLLATLATAYPEDRARVVEDIGIGVEALRLAARGELALTANQIGEVYFAAMLSNLSAAA